MTAQLLRAFLLLLCFTPGLQAAGLRAAEKAKIKALPTHVGSLEAANGK